MKRRFSLVLAVVLAVALVAVIPFATGAFDQETQIGDVEEGYTPSGTAINNAEEFAKMEPNGNYYLARNIEITATYAADFTGKLDGNGKTITTTAPLFKNLKGEVKNLKITGTVNVSDYDAGALAQRADNATVSNVLNHANVTGSTKVIALAESEYYNYKNVKDETKTKQNTYKLAGTGGLVGSATGVCAFSDCLNLGDINGSPAGGIVGVMGYDTDAASFTFVNCHNEGKITDVGTDVTNMPAEYVDANTGIGGIAGFGIDFKMLSFESCTNKGVVLSTLDGTSPAGGILGCYGRHANTNYNEVATATFNACVNEATIGGKYNCGGIMGGNNDGIAAAGCFFTNCVNKADITTSSSRSGGIAGECSKATFTGCENFGKITGTIHLGGMVGRAYSDASFKNCVNNGVINGVYAGGDYQSATAGIGGYMNGTVTAVNCQNTASVSNPNGSSVGGLFGDINGGNTNIDNCSNSGSVTGKYYVGGIVGYPEGAITISNCKNTAEAITGEYRVGGILGRASNTVTASYCANYGAVTATSVSSKYSNVGGIASSIKTGVVSDCVNYGAISATKGGRAVGGIVGYFGAENGGGETLIRCGNYGKITNGDAWSAGLCGAVAGYNDDTLIDSCFNIADVTGSNSSGGAIGYITGTGTHTITVKNSFFTGTYTSTKSGGVSTVSGYNGGTAAVVMTNVYYSVTATHESYMSGSSNVALNVNMTSEKLASGEIAFKLNEAIKAADATITEDVFFQTLGTDAHPVLDNTHKAVLKLEDGSYANELPAPPVEPEDTTTEEETTTATPSEEETTTVAPSEEETTTVAPSEEETTTVAPSEEETTTATPSEEETTTAAPSEEETTAPTPTDTEAPADSTAGTTVPPYTPDDGPVVGDSIATVITVIAIAVVAIASTVAFIVIKKKEN